MAKAPNKDGEPPSDLVGDLFHAVNDVANSPRNAEKTAEAASLALQLKYIQHKMSGRCSASLVHEAFPKGK